MGMSSKEVVSRMKDDMHFFSPLECDPRRISMLECKILWWLLYMQDAGSFQYSPRCSQIVFPHKKEREGEVVNKRLGSIHCI